MLRRIKKDKWKHFVVGIGAGLLLEWFVVHYFPASLWLASFIVFGLLVLICYGFELLSLILKRGHYDVMDAVAGVIGGVIGMAVVMIAV